MGVAASYHFLRSLCGRHDEDPVEDLQSGAFLPLGHHLGDRDRAACAEEFLGSRF